MIPYFELHNFTIGPITIQFWGLMVALGFLIGGFVSAWRAKQKGFSVDLVWDVLFWIFIFAFIFARLFHVFLYDFNHYLQAPLDALNPFLPGFSIIGGVIGSVLAFYIFTKKRKIDFWKFGDVAIFGFPLGLGIGRIGCFLIHDHPGLATNFVLGVKYPDGIIRHDHGFYLSLLGWLTFFVFLFFRKRVLKDGFFIGLWLFIYTVIRFVLDFYRLYDQRYLFLTPTQWVLIPTFVLAIWILFLKKK